MFHVWPLIDMPEARRARDRIVAFLGETVLGVSRLDKSRSARQSHRNRPSIDQNLPVSRNTSNVARMWSATAFTGALASGATTIARL